MTDSDAQAYDDMDSLGDTQFEDLSGQNIANCRAIRCIGKGAMGAVYLAEQLSLRRTVALKVLDSKFSRDLTYIERFEREAQAAARLGHYNIVQVFDFGREGDIYYIISEYVDGGNVQDLIEEEGTIPIDRAVDIIMQAANGLAAAQENQIIHRDIKPENLMLTKSNAVKIADFGLAKAINDNAAVTQAGIIVGTPFYMSPEQAKGMSLDARSDIYSLGVTFFHMITGQIPFDAESVIGVLLKQISAERPDPVAINPSLPPVVGPIVMRMMARQPEERYQNVSELIPVLQLLQHEVAGHKVEIPPPAAGIDQKRRDRYKLLHKSRVMRIARRQVTQDVAQKMCGMLKTDTGVFVSTEDLYPVNSIIDVQFTVPGQDKIYVGIGVVRWTSDRPEEPGQGVTFLKVNAVPQPQPRRSGISARKIVPKPPKKVSKEEALGIDEMGPDDKLKLLTRSQSHNRLLRYYYANTGQVIQQSDVANSLGMGARLMDEPVGDFVAVGLIERQSGGVLSMIWPEDEGLQQAIVDWIKKYGLL